MLRAVLSGFGGVEKFEFAAQYDEKIIPNVLANILPQNNLY